MRSSPTALRSALAAPTGHIQSYQRPTSLSRWSPAWLMTLALSVSACAHTPHAMPAKETAMNTPDATTATNSTLPPEEVGRRFLKLVGSVKSKEDITVERVQEIMGLTLDQNPIYPSYSQSFGNGWSYSVRYAAEMPGDSWGIDLYFINGVDPFPEDMSPVCGLNFDHYHDALVQMNFRYRNGGKDKFPGTSQYDKDNFFVQIEPSVKQTPEGNPYPACVRQISLIVPNPIPGHP